MRREIVRLVLGIGSAILFALVSLQEETLQS